MRRLTSFEIEMLQPEIRAYLRALEEVEERRERLARMVALVGGKGSSLNLRTLTIKPGEREEGG